MRTAIVVWALLGSVGAASAEGTWGILEPVSRGVDPNDAQTYRELMQAELGRQLGFGGMVMLIAGQCSDPGCAALAGQKANVDYVVMLTIGTLGQKLVSTAAVVDSKTGQPLRNERVTIDRVEDLEAVASKLAIAFVSSKPIEAATELGNVTAVEQKPAKRREASSNGAFYIKGLVPFGDVLAGVNVGMGFDFGFWYEAPNFSIEPRIGIRFDAATDERSFWVVPIDLGAHYIVGLGDFAPFFGGGLGARWTYESFTATVVSGDFIQTSSEAEFSDHAWGIGLFGRIGILLFRTYSVRMSAALEYDVTFVDLNDRGFPHTFQFSLGVIF